MRWSYIKSETFTKMQKERWFVKNVKLKETNEVHKQVKKWNKTILLIQLKYVNNNDKNRFSLRTENKNKTKFEYKNKLPDVHNIGRPFSLTSPLSTN